LRWHRVRFGRVRALGLFVVFPVMLFFVGYLCFSVPTPDETVNKQVATIDFADDSQLAKIVPRRATGPRSASTRSPRTCSSPCSRRRIAASSPPRFDPIGIARAAARQLTGVAAAGPRSPSNT